MYKCVESCAAVWEHFALCLVLHSGLSICKVALFRGQLSQFFFEISLVGMSFAVQMNRIDCLSSLHSRFFASCSSVDPFPLTRILRSLHASSLVAIRLLYLNWVSFSSKLSGGIVRSRSSIPCFANSHLLFSAMRSRPHCSLISFSFGAVNTETAPPCLTHVLMPCVPRSLSYVGCRKMSMQVFLIGRINPIFCCHFMHGFVGVESGLLFRKLNSNYVGICSPY